MKKLIVVLVAALAFTVAASAQPRAIGIRGAYGVDLSYQHSLGAQNFAELDLGLSSYGFNLSGVYDIVFANQGDFNFYAGPGATVSIGNGYFLAGLSGQVGAEWNVPSLPIQLSLDWKPTFYLIGVQSFSWEGFALGIRYRF